MVGVVTGVKKFVHDVATTVPSTVISMLSNAAPAVSVKMPDEVSYGTVTS